MQLSQEVFRIAANIFTVEANRCTDATELGVLNWTRLRQLLVDYRAHTKLGVREFSEQIGVKPSTVYRIEDISGDDTYKPELANIAKWVDFAAQIPLSAFFLQVEQAGDGLQTVELPGDNSNPSAKVAPDDSLQDFESEERIQERVLRLLSRALAESIERDARARPPDYRLPPDTRPLAAERSPHHRARLTRNVPAKKKKRPQVRRKR